MSPPTAAPPAETMAGEAFGASQKAWPAPEKASLGPQAPPGRKIAPGFLTLPPFKASFNVFGKAGGRKWPPARANTGDDLGKARMETHGPGKEWAWAAGTSEAGGHHVPASPAPTRLRSGRCPTTCAGHDPATFRHTHRRQFGSPKRARPRFSGSPHLGGVFGVRNGSAVFSARAWNW